MRQAQAAGGNTGNVLAPARTFSGFGGDGPVDLSKTVHKPAFTEVRREGGTRQLNTDTHSMRVADLCPSQGKTASNGFIDALRG